MLTFQGPVQSDDPKTRGKLAIFSKNVNNNLKTKLLAHNATTAEINNEVSHLTDVVHEALKNQSQKVYDVHIYKPPNLEKKITNLISEDT
jgi:hypothetical protein